VRFSEPRFDRSVISLRLRPQAALLLSAEASGNSQIFSSPEFTEAIFAGNICGVVLPLPEIETRMRALDAHLGLHSWTSPRGLGRIAFARAPGYRIVAGEPQCRREYLGALVDEFESECRREGLRPLYFCLPEDTLRALDPGRRRGALHVGDAPVFALGKWGAAPEIPRGVQSQARRAERRGLRVRRIADPPVDMEAFRNCLKAWLLRKNLPPLKFMTSPFLLQPWPRLGIWAAETGGRVQGFALASHSLYRDVFRLDAVVRSPEAPNGCAELLIREALRYAAGLGFQEATLGLAPLSRRTLLEHVNPLWFRVAGAWVRSGSFGYSFRSLEAFKAKFQPDAWRPLFCVSRERTVSAGDVAALLRGFAGGSLLRFAGQAVGWRLGLRFTRNWPL
jgi:lysylphosphatidylglycerol synthetase-like protein (DUF2156 family)